MKNSRYYGLFLLIASIILCLIIKWVFTPAPELKSPLPDNYTFQVRAVEPTPTPTPQPKIATVTAYSCVGLETIEQIRMNCPSMLSGEPTTANGTTPIPYKTVACDRANMGRKFEIKGVGVVTCTDTGGAINGPGRFDLYVEDVHTAYEFGKQKLEYALVEEI